MCILVLGMMQILQLFMHSELGIGNLNHDSSDGLDPLEEIGDAGESVGVSGLAAG